MYRNYIKRIFDIMGASIALVILFPIFLLLAILIRAKLGSPILFRQKRPGYKERIFTLYKLRTMTNQCNPDGSLLPDSERITKFGLFLRCTSLDELPELINIIKGDMSFIGPRPLLVKYLPLYSEQQRQRHKVRPGLSGLAQVKGRNHLSWDEKFALDLEYIKNISIWLDIKIFLLTILKVCGRKGIHSQSSITMDEFIGNNTDISPPKL